MEQELANKTKVGGHSYFAGKWLCASPMEGPSSRENAGRWKGQHGLVKGPVPVALGLLVLHLVFPEQDRDSQAKCPETLPNMPLANREEEIPEPMELNPEK